ncbi:MAG: DUF166 family protein [Candidatus Aquicultor sp.]|nr:DUF166 family protein [Candidatus Aquicultor sp.]
MAGTSKVLRVMSIKLYIISAGADPVAINQDESEYALAFNENFAQRFIKHLSNDESLCTACHDECVECRLSLVDDLSGNIAGQHKLPLLTDQFIDDPEEYLPASVPGHDITLAFNIHSDILLDVPELAAKAGSRALIVPVEDPDWLGGWTKRRLEEKCAELGLEFAAPKPFCGLTGDGYEHIKAFIQEFKVGRPEVELDIDGGIVTRAHVTTSAPCGATYYLARLFKGVTADDKLLEVACKGLSSYPCTASTKIDPDFKDSITHEANYITMDALKAKLNSP